MFNINTLDKINWDFTEAKTNGSMHSVHPYPAKFIPQIPNVCINSFTSIGETVYDPFLGSGTTCLEANILGRNSLGNDVNELSVLLAKVKTTPIEPVKLNYLDILLSKIYLRIADENSDFEIPQIINLDLWFKDFVIRELAIIKDEILKLNDEDVKNFCLVAMSAITVNVSRQDSDTRYVRVEKPTKEKDTFLKFSKQLNKMKSVMANSYIEISQAKTSVKYADTRKQNIFAENSADFAVTSPPYPNAYDYHLYHKYRLYWLDMSPKELKDNEIGCHANYSKKNGLNEFDFQRDMQKCFESVSQILKPNKYFVLVMGDSILQGRKIKNNEILKESSKDTPFVFVTEFTRNMNDKKKYFNPKNGNIKTEQILIFRNLK